MAHKIRARWGILPIILGICGRLDDDLVNAIVPDSSVVVVFETGYIYDVDTKDIYEFVDSRVVRSRNQKLAEEYINGDDIHIIGPSENCCIERHLIDEMSERIREEIDREILNSITTMEFKSLGGSL